MVVHGDVWMIPVTDDAEALEFLALHVDLFPCIVAAGSAKLRIRDIFLFAFFLLELLLDLQLDRQTVAIPARNIGRIETHHGTRAHHNVLEHLIDRMADMNVTIGVGRTIVQDKFRRILTPRAQLPMNIRFIPLFQPFRLPLRQIAAHGEIGGREKHRCFIIEFFTHYRTPLTTAKTRSLKTLEILSGRINGHVIYLQLLRPAKPEPNKLCTTEDTESTENIE